MIVLTNINAAPQTLQVVLAGAKNTNDCPVSTSYEDTPPAGTGAGRASASPGENPTNTNGVTAVTIADAPPAGYIRRIKSINLNNADLAAITLSIRFNNNGTTYVLYKITLQTLEQLTYEEGYGFVAYDSGGAVKSQAAATSSATSTASSIAGLASSQASSLAAGIVIASLNSVSSQASSMAALNPNTVSSQASSIAAGIVVASINSVSSQASSTASLAPATVSSQASLGAIVSSNASNASVQSFTSTTWSTASSTVSRAKSSFGW